MHVGSRSASGYWIGRLSALTAVAVLGAAMEASGSPDQKPYRGLLGKKSDKVRVADGKTLLWAGGSLKGDDAVWYDFTGSPIDPAELQFGIGKDRIPSIDDPLFVLPDDARLLSLPGSPYRKGAKPTRTDDIQVIGYVLEGEARAYPVALLDRHELVNDSFAGKPVTVGW